MINSKTLNICSAFDWRVIRDSVRVALKSTCFSKPTLLSHTSVGFSIMHRLVWMSLEVDSSFTDVAANEREHESLRRLRIAAAAAAIDGEAAVSGTTRQQLFL